VLENISGETTDLSLGGGIYNGGSLTITQGSMVCGNKVSEGGEGANLYDDHGGTTTVDASSTVCEDSQPAM
jgi:hypothetical protein